MYQASAKLIAGSKATGTFPFRTISMCAFEAQLSFVGDFFYKHADMGINRKV